MIITMIDDPDLKCLVIIVRPGTKKKAYDKVSKYSYDRMKRWILAHNGIVSKDRIGSEDYPYRFFKAEIIRK